MFDGSLSSIVAAALVLMALGVALSVHLPKRRAQWIAS